MIESTTYVGYGVEVPYTWKDVREHGFPDHRLMEVTSDAGNNEALAGISYFYAGDWNWSGFFLVTFSAVMDTGKPFFPRDVPGDTGEWDRQIRSALRLTGWDRLVPDNTAPGWFVVLDES